jgi:hypothetical protein
MAIILNYLVDMIPAAIGGIALATAAAYGLSKIGE